MMPAAAVMLDLGRLQSHGRDATLAQRFSKQDVCTAGEMDVVWLDHAYCRPPGEHPDAAVARPARYLFCDVPGRRTTKRGPAPLAASLNDDVVNVEDVPPAQKPPLTYDMGKALTLMRECERHVHSSGAARSDECTVDFEDPAFRSSCTPQQSKLFSRAYRCLSLDRLARLAYADHYNEPVMRRLAVDHSAKRMRHIFATCSWDVSLLAWLHAQFMDVLPPEMIAVYLDVLQSLRAKIPVLIDKLLAASFEVRRGNVASQDNVVSLLSRPWDPVINAVTQYRSKKLPGNAILLVVPARPTIGTGTGASSSSSGGASRRQRFWNTQLAALGKVIHLHVPSVAAGCSLKQWFETLVNSLRSKINELKKHFPTRPIIVLGWSTGSVAASYVCAYEQVSALVCLGFPVVTSRGCRGDIDDPLLDTRTPTLFVVGQNASAAPLAAMEDLREKINAETGLIVVGCADNNLNVRFKKKKQEGITQAVVDRCIQDEMAEFLGSVLSKISRLVPDATDSEDVAPGGATGVPPNKKARRGHAPSEPGFVSTKSAAAAAKKRPARPLGFARRTDVIDNSKAVSDRWRGEATNVMQGRQGTEGVSLLAVPSFGGSTASDSFPDVIGTESSGSPTSRRLTAAEELRQQLKLAPPVPTAAHRRISQLSAAGFAFAPAAEKRHPSAQSAVSGGSAVRVGGGLPLSSLRIPTSSVLPVGRQPRAAAAVAVQPQIRQLLGVDGSTSSLLSPRSPVAAAVSDGLSAAAAAAPSPARSRTPSDSTARHSPLASLSWLGGTVGPMVTKPLPDDDGVKRASECGSNATDKSRPPGDASLLQPSVNHM